ncbi:MAG: hypothetical protein ACD_71C00087G0002 [uncultured bacterium (gcode 4)]|uniref:Type 4 fimbrial biogenesis protein PilX N-terminal domain-containing protein n=1 Tax=uncultured bacterium (gcode 4) TaxID=1234023 RepID=K1Z511_9BACT|nr:MAG: hypothetical protein ACD_71C00087G0002 [uncultured bacterium (gcode 4)]
MFHFAKSKRGETLISVLVGVIILALAIGAITTILMQNRTIDEDYNTNNTVFLLRTNAENIVKKMDTKSLAEKDVFYLSKDSSSKIFQILTGTTNDSYRYINSDGDLVTNTGSYGWTLYSRVFLLEKNDTTLGEPHQIIKAGIKELIRK